MDEEKEIFSKKGLQAGIVTLCVSAHQTKHIHYEEQVIYVIQGQAIFSINGESCVLSQGGFFHWEAGVEHEIITIPIQAYRDACPSGGLCALRYRKYSTAASVDF